MRINQTTGYEGREKVAACVTRRVLCVEGSTVKVDEFHKKNS